MLFRSASSQPSAASVSSLTHIVVIIAIAYLVSQAMRRLFDFSLTFLELYVMQDLFEEAFEYLMGHSYSFFVSRFSGSLTHRMTRFARAFESILDSFTVQFIPTALFVVGAVIVLYLRNHMLGIALGVWSIAFIAFLLYISRIRQPIREARSEADTKMTAVLADAKIGRAHV